MNKNESFVWGGMRRKLSS